MEIQSQRKAIEGPQKHSSSFMQIFVDQSLLYLIARRDILYALLMTSQEKHGLIF